MHLERKVGKKVYIILNLNAESWTKGSDRGDNVMMITLMVTVLDDGDRFGVADKIIILATFFVMLVIFVTNILTLSPTSFTCHQHIWWTFPTTKNCNQFFQLSESPFLSSNQFNEYCTLASGQGQLDNGAEFYVLVSFEPLSETSRNFYHEEISIKNFRISGKCQKKRFSISKVAW